MSPLTAPCLALIRISLSQPKLSLCTQASLLPLPDLTPLACNHRKHHLQAFPLCQHSPHSPQKWLSTHPLFSLSSAPPDNIQNQKPQPSLPFSSLALPPTVTEKHQNRRLAFPRKILAASSTTSAEPWPAPTTTRNELSHSPSYSLLRSHILPQP